MNRVSFRSFAALILIVTLAGCSASSGSTAEPAGDPATGDPAPQVAADLASLEGEWVATAENATIVGRWGDLAGPNATVDVTIDNDQQVIFVDWANPDVLEDGRYGHRFIFGRFPTIEEEEAGLPGGWAFECTAERCIAVDSDGHQVGVPWMFEIVADGADLRIDWLDMGPMGSPEPVLECPGKPDPGTLAEATVLAPSDGGYRVTNAFMTSTGEGCGDGFALQYDVVLRRPN